MGAAVLSLALALGACATAFSLIDALILRPLPVAHAEKLFYLAWPDREMRTAPGVPREHDGFSYPLFQRMRAAAGSRLALFGSNWPVPLNPVVFDPPAAKGNWFGSQPFPGTASASSESGPRRDVCLTKKMMPIPRQILSR